MLPPRAESATGSDCTAYRAVSAHPTPLPRPVATSTPFGDAAPGTLLPEALSGCALLLLDFVTDDEEAALLRGAAGARGWRDVAGRRSAKWGGTPAPGGAAFVAEPLPAFLARAVERADAAMRADVCAACAVGCKGVNHVLANEYQAGVGILPHKVHNKRAKHAPADASGRQRTSHLVAVDTHVAGLYSGVIALPTDDILVLFVGIWLSAGSPIERQKGFPDGPDCLLLCRTVPVTCLSRRSSRWARASR